MTTLAGLQHFDEHSSPKSSIIAINIGMPVPPASGIAGASFNAPATMTSVAQNAPRALPAAPPPSTQSQLPASLDDLVKQLGLTVHAFQVIASPWVDGMPVDVAKSLNTDDLQSIRNMLRGTPNLYWPHAMTALQLVGNDSDTKVLQDASQTLVIYERQRLEKCQADPKNCRFP